MVKSGSEVKSLEILVHTTLVTLMRFVLDYYSKYNRQEFFMSSGLCLSKQCAVWNSGHAF